jgi:iron complex outermembrane receptor protein
LEDVERIEVIRGPGAMMWGSNAVNGVINIITRSTGATQGNLVTLTSGTEDHVIAGYRHGGRLGPHLTYRAFAKVVRRDSYRDGERAVFRNYGRLAGEHVFEPFGEAIRHANSGTARGGFRLDWERGDRDTVTILGDVYAGGLRRATRLPSLAPPYAVNNVSREEVGGASLVGEWVRRLNPRSETTLRLGHGFVTRENVITSFRVNATDLHFEHRIGFERHEVYWGAGFRDARDTVIDTPYLGFRPAARADQTFSLTVRDELQLVPDRLTLSAGARLEHNDYTGVEVQPSVRLLYALNSRDTIWAAYSRARRVPTRMDSDLWSNVVSTPWAQGIPVLLRQLGDPNAKSEGERAVEAGYRLQQSGRWAIDLALFRSRYTNLGALAVSDLQPQTSPVLHYVLPLKRTSLDSATAYGAELSGQWNVTRRWALKPGYTYLNLRPDGESRLAPTEATSGTDLKHQFQLRSTLDLARDWQLDANLYRLGSLPGLAIPGYTRLDLRLGWRPWRGADISVSGQNLLQDHHLEYLADGEYVATEARRALVVRCTWSF